MPVMGVILSGTVPATIRFTVEPGMTISMQVAAIIIVSTAKMVTIPFTHQGAANRSGAAQVMMGSALVQATTFYRAMQEMIIWIRGRVRTL